MLVFKSLIKTMGAFSTSDCFNEDFFKTVINLSILKNFFINSALAKNFRGLQKGCVSVPGSSLYNLVVREPSGATPALES